MSGVGSTNAMKKGSANNPFLAYSEADMASFLNSAYTGCIVKYAGPSTKKLIDANASGDAQNLIADVSKTLTKGTVAGNVPCDITIHDSQTYYRIYDLYIRRSGGVYDPIYVTNPDALPDFIYAVLLVKNYKYKNQYKGRDNIKDMDVTFLAVEESVSENPDLLKLTEKWPLTKGINGWQTNCFNTAGRITLWGYGDTVTYTNNNAYSASSFIYDEPYLVNELYKVVYGDGQYYFEEFYHISDDVTTSTVEDVAPGKTFYDFTGTKQTGTGTKINPYLAVDITTFKSFPVGSFIKWLGPNKTVLDETTGQMLIQNEIYRAVEDGDILQYVILPVLTNEATADDVAAGKEFINSNGQKVVGTKAAKPIYGVSGLYQSDPVLTRTDDAVGMSWTMNDNIISSDFDNVFPYNQMVRETIDGDVFVKIPAMYWRIGFDSNYNITDIAVSEGEMPGSENKVFVHTDAFYYGAYGASVTDNVMHSKSGVARQYSRTIEDFRTYAKARGTKYRQLDLYHMRVLDFLWLIEFATKNSDAVMQGYPICGKNCGATDSLTVPSGQLSNGGRMRWRYIEDFIGNGYEFFDGACGLGATQDESKYGQQVTDVTYTQFANGYCLSALKISGSYPLLAVPGGEVNNSNYDTYFCDYLYCLSGNFVYYRGRGGGGSLAGLFSWIYTYISNTSGNVGSRLLLIP